MSTSVRFAGSGGQGAVLSGIILAKAAVLYERRHATQKDGKFAIQTQSYGPEVRGSVTKSDVKISDERIYYPYVSVPDVFVAMSEQAYQKYASQMDTHTVVLVDQDLVKSRPTKKFYEIPANKIAQELGFEIVANVVMIGALCGVAQVITVDAVEKALLEVVSPASRELNRKALKRGHELGEKMRQIE
jgi:2-oxoglutarate ferredoxin oxidoreductase subunit gamma